ncbi:LacI family DNA-binding transcriptional regulator [Nocardioides ultimimeridianus]
MARVRIKDVAEAAGVSVSTVSLVLNDAPGARIGTDTRERVRRAADQLQYRPSSLARSLRMQRSGTLGLVSDEIASTPHAGQIIAGAHEAASNLGLTLILVDTGVERVNETREIESLLQRHVDGILYAAMYHREVEVPRLITDLPVVLVDAASVDGGYPSVVPDEEAGGYAAARELLDAGHRRIGFLTNVDDIPATRGRLAGFRRAHDELGVPVDDRLVVAAVSETLPGYVAARELLEQRRPTALFCFNDRMAMGAYRAATELGLRIPDDLSIIGYDDQQLISAGLFPALTTVALPHFQMGVRGVQMLVERIEQPDGPPGVEVLGCPLVRRDSVSPPEPR